MPMAPGLARKQAGRWLVDRHRAEFLWLRASLGRIEAIRGLVSAHQDEYEQRVRALQGTPRIIAAAQLARLLRAPPRPSLN